MTKKHPERDDDPTHDHEEDPQEAMELEAKGVDAADAPTAAAADEPAATEGDAGDLVKPAPESTETHPAFSPENQVQASLGDAIFQTLSVGSGRMMKDQLAVAFGKTEEEIVAAADEHDLLEEQVGCIIIRSGK